MCSTLSSASFDFLHARVYPYFMEKDIIIDESAKVYDYLFLLRPLLWVPVWVFLFIGYMYGARIELFSISLILPKKFWFTLITYTFLMSSTYIVNQIVDRESDRINRKLFLIPNGIISVRNATIYAVFLGIVSLILSFFIGGPVLLFLYFVSLVMGLLYSIPPIQTKGKPFLDIIFNGIGYGCVAFIVGWSVAERINLHSLTVSFGYFLLVSAVFVNTTIPDIPGDRRSGKITTGVFLGKRLALLFSSLLFVFSLVYAFLEMDILIIVPSIFGAIFSVLSLWDNTEDMILTKVSYRLPAVLFILLVSVKFPTFLLLNLILLFALRKYYKERFGMNYPALLGR